MDEVNNVRGKVWETLYHSEKRAMSASDVSEEIGDVSRQYIGRVLRDMANSQSQVGRVEIGPSVGYYWNSDSVDNLDSEFDGKRLFRGSLGIRTPLLCLSCNEKIEIQDSVLAIFERTGKKWDALDLICNECFLEHEDMGIIQSSLPGAFTSISLPEGKIAFAAVYGTLVEEQFTDQNSGQEVSATVIKETSVVEFLRSSDFTVVPEFE